VNLSALPQTEEVILWIEFKFDQKSLLPVYANRIHKIRKNKTFRPHSHSFCQLLRRKQQEMESKIAITQVHLRSGLEKEDSEVLGPKQISEKMGTSFRPHSYSFFNCVAKDSKEWN